MVRLTVRFTSTVTGLLADPVVVSLAITPPNSIDPAPAIVHEGLGIFHADVRIDQFGVWQYRWQGEGGVVAATPTGAFQGV